MQAQISGSDRQVLLDLYASTNGATWATNTGWGGAPGTECSWYGIACFGGGYSIDLDANNLTGTLPGDLNSSINLLDFSVIGNRLTGSIPSLTGLTKLLSFNVSFNRLTGSLPALTGLNSLHVFFAAGNQLTGSIPVLDGLTGLTEFNVSGNQLTGSIPALPGLTSLTQFAVHDNQLTGSIPALTGLTNLIDFSVGANQLTGDVPAVPSPNALEAGGSNLCPNNLNHMIDPAWDAATGVTPWYTNCGASIRGSVGVPGIIVTAPAHVGGRR